MKADIRIKDLVKIRPGLTANEKERIAKFARIVSGETDMSYYAMQILNGRSNFKVKERKKTQKTPTEYAILITKDEIYVPVQTRYLLVAERKPRHPLTNIFLD